MNIMATLLKVYGFLDTLADNVSDETYREECRVLWREVRTILDSEGFEAKYSEDFGVYVLLPKNR